MRLRNYEAGKMALQNRIVTPGIWRPYSIRIPHTDTYAHCTKYEYDGLPNHICNNARVPQQFENKNDSNRVGTIKDPLCDAFQLDKSCAIK